ncbi:glutaminase A [Citricoccus sp. NR2]|uniref:glutaminase A n=1 Tax=Citricoccus sp. NR2 TaxID=3004095 RepID=UPI0022DD02AE|nr:glutaminase A [Citricoccus sp. NR2]WBL19049.1 glutaminase A [Citricoccus sp. NR2]
MESPLQEYLDELIDRLRPIDDGEVNQATLSAAEPHRDHVGITLTTINGNQYSAGDCQVPFAIQSISKAFTYGLAVDDLGAERVVEKVDVEPSGDPFNEISLQPDGRPDNPMINAGAIATVGLIKGRGGRDRMGRLLNTYNEAAAGSASTGELKVSDQIYKAEDRTGHRNRALAWLLRSFDIIESDPEPVVQDYFRACSVMLTVEQLSMMAATLANRGVNPATGHRVFSPSTTSRLLAVMSTCGMYDDAGNWAIEVGLPAKSGVGGGLLVVIPGQVGIAVYSPPLDEHGTSVRGSAAVKQLTADLGLHYGDAPPVGRSTLRASYALSESTSGVPRPHRMSEALERLGKHGHVIEISGDLGFAETEILAHTVAEIDPDITTVLLDLRAVDEFGRSAIHLLVRLVRQFLAENRDLALIDQDDRLTGLMVEAAERAGDPLPDPREESAESTRGAQLVRSGKVTGEFRLFHTRPRALEWAELRVLQRFEPKLLPNRRQRPDQSQLFAFLGDDDVQLLTAFMDRRSFKAGQVIRRAGQPFAGIYFIESGQVELTSQGSGGRRYRPVFLSPGMTFGEIALGRTGRQLTTVRAVDAVVCRVLTAQIIASLEETAPQLAIKLWTAISREAYTLLEQSSREAGARHD